MDNFFIYTTDGKRISTNDVLSESKNKFELNRMEKFIFVTHRPLYAYLNFLQIAGGHQRIFNE